MRYSSFAVFLGLPAFLPPSPTLPLSGAPLTLPRSERCFPQEKRRGWRGGGRDGNLTDQPFSEPLDAAG